MMTCFYLTDSFWQIVLLVISQLSIISLASGGVILFKLKCKAAKLLGMSFILMLNIILYVMMQIDSRITRQEPGVHLHVPYLILLFITLLSLGFCVWAILSETKNRKYTINPNRTDL